MQFLSRKGMNIYNRYGSFTVPHHPGGSMRSIKCLGIILTLSVLVGCANTNYREYTVVKPEKIDETVAQYKELETKFYEKRGEMGLYLPDLEKLFPFLKEPEKSAREIKNEKPQIQIQCKRLMENDALREWLARDGFHTDPPVEYISFREIRKSEIVDLLVLHCPLDYSANFNKGGLSNFFGGYTEWNDGHEGFLKFAFMRDPNGGMKLTGLRYFRGSAALEVGTKDSIVNRAAGGFGNIVMGGVNRGISMIK
mgnify:CR=1 FL=1